MRLISLIALIAQLIF